MNLLFIGASKFGLRCLKLLSGMEFINIIGIISNDQTFKISYNQKGVTNYLYADFSSFAQQNNIPFYRLKENMREKELADFISACAPDFCVVSGWYHKIPKEYLNMVKFAGLHASLLPDYSGGAPLVWALINGEKKTGITFFLLDEGVDSGDIIGQKEVEIEEDDNIQTLYEKIELLGLSLLTEFIPKIADGTVSYIKQDHSKRRIFPQRKPEDGLINWDWDARQIKNFIRAQTKPYPGAYTFIHGKRVTIWDAEIENP
jgi:methionyl-tRNA formyltransferase